MHQFDRTDFHPLKKTLHNNDLKSLLSENFLDQKINKKFKINDVSSLSRIVSNSILFLKKNINISSDNLNQCNIITDNKDVFNNLDYNSVQFVKNIESAYNLILSELFFHEDSLNFPDSLSQKNGSYISNFSKINSSTEIQKNCYIGRGVRIGNNCIIKNNVILKNVIIGNNVIVGDNTTIGSTGFGFNLKNMGASNISPHIGIVLIEDNVSIGSNCAIDRGKIDFTYIGENCMLDNLVHIAHNVTLKSNVCIAAQSGISGSTYIGNNVTIGGQSGLAGHIEIGDNVMIAAKSGVTKNINSNSIVAGFPAVDIKKWKKDIINIRKYGHK